MPDDLTLAEARKHRDELYQTIADAILKFEDATGLIVTGVDYGPSLVPDMGDDEEYEHAYELDIVVELD